ncbi:MAG TPA: serine hydrolase domain-containing protein [Ignavibacteria bacterium]|nr:hypothetical protein [Bacteroidota bacterium]HRI84536.1 serine hydrolase domain-containing protein [Ignavibacteria bacterium]HRK00424.1 serine hydrolase domain-containing protein [Ignavibacteria bacterium]
MKSIYTKSVKIILNVTLIYFLLAVCSTGYISAQRDNTELTVKLNSYIDSVYEVSKVPGIVAGIFTPDFNYMYAVGKADLRTGELRKYDDLIRIGSITKTFVATVILQLADEGKLALDDKLSRFFPSYPNSENITVRQLLDMTSGIPDFLNDPVLLAAFYNGKEKITQEEIFERTIALGPVYPPGQGWNYSNGNYNILGMMIEQITGNKTGDEVTNRIIRPLVLSNTIYPTDGNISGVHSHGYFADTVTGTLTDCTFMEPSLTGAAGCMVSNLPDLKIYVEALVKGTLLSPQMQAERLKFVNTGLSKFVTYGLGIFNLDGFIGHNGGITGYNTTMCYNPELDAVILVSVNQFDTKLGISDHVFMELAKMVFPDKKLFQ